MDGGQPVAETDVGCAKTPPAGAAPDPRAKERPRKAAMKPRTGDGPMEGTKEGRGIVMRGPLEGGGGLLVELNATAATDLVEALKVVLGWHRPEPISTQAPSDARGLCRARGC